MAAGLYVGFIGRIVLKDFRDVRGDRLFGKRTWLVRHGRVATCRLSAACSIAGTVIVVAIADRSLTFAISELVLLVATLLLLRAVADDRGHRRDERLISSIAICGRGVILVLLAQLTLVRTDMSSPYRVAVLAGLTIVLLGQAWSMARHGPPLTPAPDWAHAATSTRRPTDPGAGSRALPPHWLMSGSRTMGQPGLIEPGAGTRISPRSLMPEATVSHRSPGASGISVRLPFSHRKPRSLAVASSMGTP